MHSKTGKFRRGSQGNHPAALSIYKDSCGFFLQPRFFCLAHAILIIILGVRESPKVDFFFHRWEKENINSKPCH